MKLAVGTERLTGVSGFALSMLVESAWKAHAGASTIQIDVSSMSSGGWKVNCVDVFAVIVLGVWPRPVPAITRMRFPTSTLAASCRRSCS